jgi:outer membrane lipoprotein-sorting protein
MKPAFPAGKSDANEAELIPRSFFKKPLDSFVGFFLSQQHSFMGRVTTCGLLLFETISHRATALKLHQEFQIGAHTQHDLGSVLGRADTILASAQTAVDLPEMKLKGWTDAETTAFTNVRGTFPASTQTKQSGQRRHARRIPAEHFSVGQPRTARAANSTATNSAGKMKKLISTVLLIAFAVSFISRNAFATDPSAQEILEKAKTSMESMMKCRIIVGTNEMVFYQKILTNGITASRCEMSTPIKKINLNSDGKMYELYPDANVAIDQDFMLKTMQQISQGRKESSLSLLGNFYSYAAKLIGLSTYEGKNCFDIQAIMPPEVQTNLQAMLPEKAGKLDIEQQYLIETNTYHILQTKVFSQGSPISKMEFKDIEMTAELPNDLFMVPKGYKIEKPSSLEEYAKIVGDCIVAETYVKTNLKKMLPKGFAIDPKTQDIVKVDPKTGAFIPITNTATSSAYQFGTSNNQKTIRIAVLSILVTSSVGFLVVIIINQCRRKKSD